MNFLPARPISSVSRKQEKAAGFSHFEFAVTTALIAILATVFLQRILYYQEETERVQVLHVVAGLRTVLQMKTGELELRSRGAEAAALIDQNPMSWLPEQPSNYLGEYYAPVVEDIDRGNWYFDGKKRVLVYLLRHGKFFASTEETRWFFKVEFSRLPTIPAKPPGTPNKMQQGVVLNQVNG
ncbi:MAG TPA: hypothetical protein VGP06_05860 [Janthinobacterium sp.]|jgi:general secretion pathway protein G|nr:hypothetical protein [Janthinobacterium sp.]